MYIISCIMRVVSSNLIIIFYYTVNICIILPHRPVMVGPTSVAL